jgi:hypothetical protein
MHSQIIACMLTARNVIVTKPKSTRKEKYHGKGPEDYGLIEFG